jgi:agmatinase
MNKKTNNPYIFDIKSGYHKSRFIILPVPFDGTSSYRKSSQNAPLSILQGSSQVDLFDSDFGHIYRKSVYMERISEFVVRVNFYICKIATHLKTKHLFMDKYFILKKINNLMALNNDFVYNWTVNVLNDNKVPVIIGGEHSVIKGAIKACVKCIEDPISILHIDAHLDMRLSYQFLRNSHASVIKNITKIPGYIYNILQIGIRDFSFNEYRNVKLNSNMFIFLDKDIRRYKLLNAFCILTNNIINRLSEHVYITVDIDGLDSIYCPNTGTPVPGGLSFDQLISIIRKIQIHNKTVIGFDICETSCSFNDSIVAIRLLYKMIGAIK